MEETRLQFIQKSWSRLIRSDTTQTNAYSAYCVSRPGTVVHSARWHPQTGVKFDSVWFSVSIDAVLSISISLIINISSIGIQSTLEDVWLSARQTSSLHPFHWLFLLSPALYSLAIIFLSLHTLCFSPHAWTEFKGDLYSQSQVLIYSWSSFLVKLVMNWQFSHSFQ